MSLAIVAIKECALRYGFSAEEALLGLNLSSVEAVEVSEKKSRKARGSSRVDVEKPKVVRSAFPLPYNGEMNESCCFGLRLCEGLYTQCRVARKGESSFCKVCEEVALLNNGVPTYGTIQERKACYDSNVEFKDPKGKSPVAYSRVMRKHKLSESQVVEEAGKLNMIINPVHFTAVEGETKRGRPKAANKAPKEPKGAKGRPKKSKKVTGVILQVSRAAGETAPVLFTGAAFYLPILPTSVWDQTMALSMHVFALVTQVPNVSDDLKYGTALVLIGVVLLFNSFAIALRVYLRRNRRW